MNNPAPLVVHNDQHVKKLESGGGHNEEVHRGNATGMVAEESPPTLRGLAPGFGTILPDGCARRCQSQFSQLVAYARAAPGRVGPPHSVNELDQFRVRSRSPTPVPGLPSPEHPKSRSLPADECIGLEEHQRVSPIGPNSPE